MSGQLSAASYQRPAVSFFGYGCCGCWLFISLFEVGLVVGLCHASQVSPWV